MFVITTLCVLTLFPLQGAFEKETLTVAEGQNLDLRCTMTGHNESALEWRDPNEFVIFFNTWRGIRDQRYTMTHYSNNTLWVHLSNVTVHDEGVYTCVSYGSTIRTKQVNVTVLAAPAKLLLDVSPGRAENQDERTVLRCSTWGSKPPPQITWLLDSGLELFGVTDNQLEGKKFNSASILSVHTYTQKSSISCVIRHKALGEEKLTTTLYPKALETVTEQTPTAFEFPTITLGNTQYYAASEKMLDVMEEKSNISTLSPNAEAATLSSNSTPNDLELQLNTTEVNSSGRIPSTSTEVTPLDSNTINGPNKIFNVTKRPTAVRTPSSNADIQTLNSQTTDAESSNTLNVMERNFSTQATPLITDEAKEANLTYKEIRQKTPTVLLPVLVTVLLFALFIVVLLLVTKLWKAHQEWKKENEVSEQTVESNRPKPNDDNFWQEKNGHANPWKSSKKYVIHGSCTRTSKNSEGSQESSVFEKQIPYVKETDL